MFSSECELFLRLVFKKRNHENKDQKFNVAIINDIFG